MPTFNPDSTVNKLRRIKKLALFFFISTAPVLLFSNVAQPGIWNAGGAANFSLLFPEDSSAFKKIQMVNESVIVQLYEGFAVIKGIYWMFNTTGDTLSFRTGYPLNSIMRDEKSQYLVEIKFDELYRLRVLVNSVKVKLTETPVENTRFDQNNSNWYVWQNTFPPFDTTLIEVYFIVNTSNSSLLDGYKLEDINGFIYLLESGATWKQPIKNGRILIELMNPLTFSDIKGISPENMFTYNNEMKLLKANFTNLIPASENNIIINYTKNQGDFDLSSVVAQSEKYFNKIDKLEKTDIRNLTFQATETGSPFKSHKFNWFGVVLISVFIVIPALIIFMIIRLIFRFRGKRKSIE